MRWSDSETEIQDYLDFLVKITVKGPIEGEISLLGRLFQQGHWAVG